MCGNGYISAKNVVNLHAVQMSKAHPKFVSNLIPNG